MKKMLVIICCGLFFTAQGSVYINENETGEVLLIPFYSVANDLTTMVSISNGGDEYKVVKVTVRDGQQSQRLLSFNVFLKGHDIWTMGLLRTSADSVSLVTNDQSCTTLEGDLPIYQDLLTFEIDPDNELTQEEIDARMEIGSIEVYELAEVKDSDNFLKVAMDESNCGYIRDQYGAGGLWQDDLNNDEILNPVDGGLHGAAYIIDVANGFVFNSPVTHFDHFYSEGTVFHRSPEDSLPDLSSGDPVSLLIDEGRVVETRWPTGYEAISALLMKSTLSNEFEISEGIGAATEWVISFPTLRFYQRDDGFEEPFVFEAHNPNLFYFPFPNKIRANLPNYGIPDTVTDQYDSVFDREGNSINSFDCLLSACPPHQYLPSSSNTILISFTSQSWNLTQPLLAMKRYNDLEDDDAFNNPHNVLGLEFGPDFPMKKQQGKVELRINENYTRSTLRGVDIHTNQPVEYRGLPVTGFAFSRYINANAQEGLLATYASSTPHFGERSINTPDD